jgi:hypothetical protein
MILLAHTTEIRMMMLSLMLHLHLLLHLLMYLLPYRILGPLLEHHVLFRLPQVLAALSASDMLLNTQEISMEKTDTPLISLEMWKILILGRKWLRDQAACSTKTLLVTFLTQLHHTSAPRRE